MISSGLIVFTLDYKFYARSNCAVKSSQLWDRRYMLSRWFDKHNGAIKESSLILKSYSEKY